MTIQEMLKDYIRKLERDDFDSRAIEKMQAANAALHELSEKQVVTRKFSEGREIMLVPREECWEVYMRIPQHAYHFAFSLSYRNQLSDTAEKAMDLTYRNFDSNACFLFD